MSHYTGAVPSTKRATDWRDNGLCSDLDQDPEDWFPKGETGPWAHAIAEAKAVCRRCPSQEPCLQWALNTGEEHGVWGGLSEAERRTMLRRRTAANTISVDDYTGTPRTPQQARTLEEAWRDGTEADGEHLRWVGSKTVHHTDGAVTPNRLSFYLDRGRWPEGDVKRTCDAGLCVKPSHLADRRERAEEADLAVAV